MTPSLTQLIATLSAIGHQSAPTTSAKRLRDRSQLDALLAASDEDAAGAIAHLPHLATMLAHAPTFWLSHLGERHVNWLADALAVLFRQNTPASVGPLLDALHHFRPGPRVLALYEQALTGPWRLEAARRLYQVRTEPARQILLRHDGPDLDEAAPGLRLNVRLGYSVDEQTPDLLPFLDPAVLNATRAQALFQLAVRLGKNPLDPALEPLVLRCLDDDVAPEHCLTLLVGRKKHVDRPDLFRRLWTVAQAQDTPWFSLPHERLFEALVRTAPAIDPVAILLDTLTADGWGTALVQAIRKRPDPGLVTPLERWARDNPDETSQKVVQRTIEACHKARSWSR